MTKLYSWYQVCVRGVCVLSCFSRIWLFATPWTVAHQAALSMGFSRQEYWSGSSFPSPGYPPDPGIEPRSLMSPALAGRLFTTGACWEERLTVSHSVVPELNYSRLRLCFVQSWLLWPHRLEPARLLCPWDSPGKKTQVGCHFLLRGIFPTQGSNPGLLHCRHIQREYCLCQSDSLPTEIEGKPNRLPLFYDKIMLPF